MRAPRWIIRPSPTALNSARHHLPPTILAPHDNGAAVEPAVAVQVIGVATIPAVATPSVPATMAPTVAVPAPLVTAATPFAVPTLVLPRISRGGSGETEECNRKSRCKLCK